MSHEMLTFKLRIAPDGSPRWRELDALRGEHLRVNLADGTEIVGIESGVDADGRLLLRLPSGALFPVVAGDVAKAISAAAKDDLDAILELQKAAFAPVAKIVNNPRIQPLLQTCDELLAEHRAGVILKYESGGGIIGSVRARLDADNACHVGKLIVHPDFQRRGIGEALMREIEKHFPACEKFALFTGEETPHTLRLYEKLGYAATHKDAINGIPMIFMERNNNLNP